MRAVLTYHSIDRGGSPISVSEESFDGHRRWLERGHVRVLSLEELAAHPDTGPDALALTFDDGFLNTRGPIASLRAANLPATIFAVTGHVGGTNAWGGVNQEGIPTLPLLDWADLEHLVERGVSVEAHTRTHPALDTLTAAAIDDELGQCAEELRARLGVSATHVAYPFGAMNETVVARASVAYRFGYTTEFRKLSRVDTVMMLPRLDMYYFNTPDALDGWGGQAFTWRLRWIRARRAVRARLLPR